MSNKEQVISLLDKLPEYKIAYILAFAQGVAVSDESDDDAFCQRLVDNYLNDDYKFNKASEYFKTIDKELQRIKNSHKLLIKKYIKLTISM